MASSAKPKRVPAVKISPELRLLSAFSGQPRPLSRSDLEKTTGLPQATVNRAIQILVKRNLLRHAERGHRPTYTVIDPATVAQMTTAMQKLFPELTPQARAQGDMPWIERLRPGRRQVIGAHRIDPALGAAVDPAERERFLAELPPVEQPDNRVRAPFQGRQR